MTPSHVIVSKDTLSLLLQKFGWKKNHEKASSTRKFPNLRLLGMIRVRGIGILSRLGNGSHTHDLTNKWRISVEMIMPFPVPTLFLFYFHRVDSCSVACLSIPVIDLLGRDFVRVPRYCHRISFFYLSHAHRFQFFTYSPSHFYI